MRWVVGYYAFIILSDSRSIVFPTPNNLLSSQSTKPEPWCYLSALSSTSLPHFGRVHSQGTQSTDMTGLETRLTACVDSSPPNGVWTARTYIWYQAIKNGVPKPTTAKVATLTASQGLFLTDVGSALGVSYPDLSISQLIMEGGE
jgi:hypothetical protein